MYCFFKDDSVSRSIGSVVEFYKIQSKKKSLNRTYKKFRCLKYNLLLVFAITINPKECGVIPL